MKPRINDGDVVTIAPCDPATIEKNDVVLVKVRGNTPSDHGRINGWAGRGSVLGRVTEIGR